MLGQLPGDPTGILWNVMERQDLSELSFVTAHLSLQRNEQRQRRASWSARHFSAEEGHRRDPCSVWSLSLLF